MSKLTKEQAQHLVDIEVMICELGKSSVSASTGMVELFERLESMGSESVEKLGSKALLTQYKELLASIIKRENNVTNILGVVVQEYRELVTTLLDTEEEEKPENVTLH